MLHTSCPDLHMHKFKSRGLFNTVQCSSGATCNCYEDGADSQDPSEHEKKQVNGHFVMQVSVISMQPERRDMRTAFTFSFT